MRRWWIGPAVAVAAALLVACGTPSVGVPAEQPTGTTSSDWASASVDDPNAAGRASAAATRPAATSAAAAGMPGGAGICANETLAESMTRAVDNGASVIVGSGAFTGTVRSGDGEIGVPYSEVALTVDSTLAGRTVAPALSAWVYGDLAAGGQSATTGETSSLWARGGRLVAVIDPQTGAGLPGPVVRVAPVIGDDVIFSWVGCWSTAGVSAREFDGAVDLFDDRGVHPAAETDLFAVRLSDFSAALPQS